jgi:hypothetical protein
MMDRVVLAAVDKDLAERLTQILIGKGWNAGHQRSYPVVEVMVKTETDLEAAPLRPILERHIIRQTMKIKDEKGLIRELPNAGQNGSACLVDSPRHPKVPQHGQKPSHIEIEETFEELQRNPLRVMELFNKYSNGRDIFYLRSRTGGYTIGFSRPKGKKHIKFWVVGR